MAKASLIDQRDNSKNPTSGYFASITQEVAGLGGYDRYIKHEVKASYYYPIASKWNLDFLASGGNIYGFNQDVRITNRFFLGGNNFRGFEQAGVGPRDTSTLDASAVTIITLVRLNYTSHSVCRMNLA